MTSTLYPIREPFLERMGIKVGFERRPGFTKGSWYTSWIQWQCHRHGAGGEKIMLREQEGRLADLYTFAFISFCLSHSASKPLLPLPVITPTPLSTHHLTQVLTMMKQLSAILDCPLCCPSLPWVCSIESLNSLPALSYAPFLTSRSLTLASPEAAIFINHSFIQQVTIGCLICARQYSRFLVHINEQN